MSFISNKKEYVITTDFSFWSLMKNNMCFGDEAKHLALNLIKNGYNRDWIITEEFIKETLKLMTSVQQTKSINFLLDHDLIEEINLTKYRIGNIIFDHESGYLYILIGINEYVLDGVIVQNGTIGLRIGSAVRVPDFNNIDSDSVDELIGHHNWSIVTDPIKITGRDAKQERI